MPVHNTIVRKELTRRLIQEIKHQSQVPRDDATLCVGFRPCVCNVVVWCACIPPQPTAAYLVCPFGACRQHPWAQGPASSPHFPTKRHTHLRHSAEGSSRTVRITRPRWAG